MANLRTCSRCKSTIDESYFSINRKKELYKTCDTCRNRNKKTNNIEIKVESESDAEKLEEEWMTTFYKENKYPSYGEVVEIIKSDLTLFSEYGEFNHTLLNKMWDGMVSVGSKGDEDKIKVIGRLINERGGFWAMTCNHSVFIIVLRHFLKKSDQNDIIRNTILLNSYKHIENLWHGIGEWKR